MYRRFLNLDPRRIVDSVTHFASYVLLISVSAVVALVALAAASRFGVIVAKQSAALHWDERKSSKPRVRSAVLNDGITFRYLPRRDKKTAVPAAKLKGKRSGLIKSAPEQEFKPWGIWNWGQPEPPVPEPVRPATYRTVCVRLCDGAFFPISFSTPTDRFGRDEKICQSTCGSPAKLYVYRNPGGDVEQMRDVDGEPYTKLETAFRYKTTYDAACTCKAQPWETASIEKHRQYAELQEKSKSDKKAAAELRKLMAPPVRMDRRTAGKNGPAANVKILSTVTPAAASAEARKGADKSNSQASGLKPSFAASEVPTSAQAKPGRSPKSRSRQARVYDGTDWRINGFQAN